MKHSKRCLNLFLSALLLIAVLCPAMAVSDVNAEPGKTAVLNFTFSNVYDVDGTFVVNDPGDIVASYLVEVAEAGKTNTTVVGDRFIAEPVGDPEKTTVSVRVQVTLRETAAEGSRCSVSFAGTYGDANGAPGSSRDVYQSAAVIVKGAASAETTTPGNTNDPAPVVTSQPVSYTALQRQIDVASGLKASDYTSASASNLQAALSSAKAALKSTTQAEVDAATKALQRAVAGLKKVSHTALREALTAAEEFVASEALAGQWQQLVTAIEEGNALLTSRDQTAVDSATARINDEVAQFKADLAGLKSPELVEVEVPVEVLPEGDFCNIPMHPLWQILFFVSAALNVALVVLIVTYTIKKKKFQNDDTPLVDYDIGDDF